MRIINLLPPSEQNLLRKEEILGNLKAVFVLAVFSYLLVAAGLIGEHFYLQKNASNLQDMISKQEQVLKDQDQTQQAVQKDNAIVTDYTSIGSNQLHWSKILEDFATLVPSDVLITDLSADTQSKKIDIQGQSSSRDSVLQLRSNISSSELFNNIDLPLQNLEKPTNLQFHYSFYLSNWASK